MRSLKLTAALAAALALVPAGALAARGHAVHKRVSAGGTCHVKLSVAPRLVTAGETTLAYGELLCGGNGESNQTVTLYERAIGSGGYTVAATTTTDPHGFYQVTTPALTNNSSFYVTAGTAQSVTKQVRVASQVTLTGPAEGAQLQAGGLRTGRRNAVTFTGTVSPTDTGALVVLQRENAVKGNEWHRIDAGLVTATGTFSITHIFRVAGDANIRVLVRSFHRNVASASNTLTYEISQTQNPQLTIVSSSDPISFGQQVTISGVAAGAPNTAVKLLARSALQSGYTPVAEVKTDSAGNYSFPAQSPLVSTFYRVQDASTRSAVLYEGVKYVLSAASTPTAVQSGQSVTFTGTISPESNGHAIYLERLNALGSNFHVIQVGTVTGSTYSITHTFYGVGTQVVRVKIPGDPDNGGTASQTFTVTVAPAASAQTIAPEAPGNSTLPPEGQV